MFKQNTLQIEDEKEPDPADIIAGALQTSRGHAIELMREALAEPTTVREPVSGVVIREGLPTLLQDRHIKSTDERLYTHPSPTVDEQTVEDADRWRALLACGRIRIIGTAGVNGSGVHDPLASSPHGEPFGNYVHFGAEFWSTFPDQDYYNTKENPAYARATLKEFADACRAGMAGNPKHN